MKKTWTVIGIVALVSLGVACGGGGSETATTTDTAGAGPATTETVTKPSDETRGLGKFKDVQLTTPLDPVKIEKGTVTYDVKCASCHKLTDEKLVGPGWKDVTKRRKPEWILNFSTNTDEMLNKDAESMAMLEACLVRMPNQNLSDDEAFGVLEMMRQNDGEK